MANEYNRFTHHHHHYHHHHHHLHTHLHINHRGTFLPMLCSRPSIKDVQVPNNASSFSSDSVSPRISCMGQVKRNNKVAGFPITSQTNNNSNNIKYSKLKKLFSSKNLTAATPTKTATSCRSRNRRSQVSNVKQDHRVTTTINLVDLDPPLPVIKRVQKSPQQGEEGSLWKRRSGGVALEGLQLKQLVHHPKHQTQSTTV